MAYKTLEKEREYQREYRKKNRERINFIHRKYYKKHKKRLRRIRRGQPEKRDYAKRRLYQKDYFLRKYYGINILEFNEMRKSQNDKCAICNLEVKLLVDHDHKSGKIRGLLCSKCNCGIGYFKDDAKLLESAKEYLNKNNNN